MKASQANTSEESPLDLLRKVTVQNDATAFGRSLGLDLDNWQAEVLSSYHNRWLLNCARQTGKTTTIAVKALHYALTNKNALILILAPIERQSTEIFHSILAFYRESPIRIPTKKESSLQMELENGSRIIALPGKEKTVRVYSGVDLLIIDEAARVPDDLYYTVRPMLATSGGTLFGLSTPFGRRGWWYEAWERGKEWKRIKNDAWSCPRITNDFLEEEKEVLGEWWFKQEYECEFLEGQHQIFSEYQIEAAESEMEEWSL